MLSRLMSFCIFLGGLYTLKYLKFRVCHACGLFSVSRLRPSRQQNTIALDVRRREDTIRLLFQTLLLVGTIYPSPYILSISRGAGHEDGGQEWGGGADLPQPAGQPPGQGDPQLLVP